MKATAYASTRGCPRWTLATAGCVSPRTSRGLQASSPTASGRCCRPEAGASRRRARGGGRTWGSERRPASSRCSRTEADMMGRSSCANSAYRARAEGELEAQLPSLAAVAADRPRTKPGLKTFRNQPPRPKTRPPRPRAPHHRAAKPGVGAPARQRPRRGAGIDPRATSGLQRLPAGGTFRPLHARVPGSTDQLPQHDLSDNAPMDRRVVLPAGSVLIIGTAKVSPGDRRSSPSCSAVPKGERCRGPVKKGVLVPRRRRGGRRGSGATLQHVSASTRRATRPTSPGGSACARSELTTARSEAIKLLFATSVATSFFCEPQPATESKARAQRLMANPSRLKSGTVRTSQAAASATGRIARA